MPSLFSRLIGIAVAGGLGALAGSALMGALGLSGVSAAVLRVILAMPLAVGIFIGWIFLLRAMGGR